MEHRTSLGGGRRWFIRSAEGYGLDGAEISTTGVDTSDWQPAVVPMTVLGNLIAAGVYRDVYLERNLETIPEKPFDAGWWYRTEFELAETEAEGTVRLAFDGINYRGAIWLNGHPVAAETEVFGTFRTWVFDVTEFARAGVNVLAVETWKPRPGDFRLDFADWNPRPQDRCMGLWRDVALHVSGAVSVGNAFVQSRLDIDTLARADLRVRAELRNHGTIEVAGRLRVKIGDIVADADVTLAAGERRTVGLDAADFPQLRIENPRVWWPHHMGEQDLYEARIDFSIRGAVSDETTVTFGIRQVADYFTEDGHRGFIVNGRPLLLRGAGWTDDMFLMDTDESVEAQIRYVRHMGLNCIRLEGIWGKSERLYELCDRYGILVLAGWSCQWEWEGQLGKPCDEFVGAETEEDMDLLAAMTRDQVLWLRNHPCILAWLWGSDKLPRPALERRYIAVMKECDDRPYVMSAAGHISSVTGPTGMKMRGPYDYCPPVYWYRDTKKGGAFGFNTETGPGPQPCPLESTRKMVGPDHLWPVDEHWHFHCARGVPLFNRLDTFRAALDKRYGPSHGVEDFLRKAQMQSYEAMRAMFEAFAAYRPKATGVIQWKLNSAWPSMFWQLYDAWLLPNGAFYGAKKACSPVHVLFDYDKRDIYVVNATRTRLDGLVVEARCFDIDSKELGSQTAKVDIDGNESIAAMRLRYPGGLTRTWFLALRLKNDRGTTLASNFYWLSTQDDVMDYKPAQYEHLYTPQCAWADLRALADLPRPELAVSSKFQIDGDEHRFTIDLANRGNRIAFFIEVRIVGDKRGESILPVFLDDNYVSLLPGERRRIAGRFASKNLGDERPVALVDGRP